MVSLNIWSHFDVEGTNSSNAPWLHIMLPYMYGFFGPRLLRIAHIS